MRAVHGRSVDLPGTAHYGVLMKEDQLTPLWQLWVKWALVGAAVGLVGGLIGPAPTVSRVIVTALCFGTVMTSYRRWVERRYLRDLERFNEGLPPIRPS